MIEMDHNLLSPTITTIGLICDIIGAILVAIEVVKVFKGPTTIDIGRAGTLSGGFVPEVNPEYQKHEKAKHKIMKIGLAFLTLGFILQIVGAWWPIITECS